MEKKKGGKYRNTFWSGKKKGKNTRYVLLILLHVSKLLRLRHFDFFL